MNAPTSRPPNLPPGPVLAVDMVRLWDVGRIEIPNQAVEFVGANHRVSDTAAWGDVFGDSAASRLTGPKWIQLRDVVMRMLAETADNLTQTGTAIVEMANSYAGHDERAKQWLATHSEKMEDEGRKSTPTLQPPPKSIPSPRRPLDHTPRGPGGV